MALTQLDLDELGNTAFPLHYRLMVFHQIPVATRGKYLVPVEIPESDLRGLEVLVDKHDLRAKIQLEEELGSSDKSRCFDLLRQVRDTNYYDDAVSVDEALEHFKSICADGVTIFMSRACNSNVDVSKFLNGEHKRARQCIDDVRSSEISCFRKTVETIKRRFLEYKDRLPAEEVRRQLYQCDLGFERLYVAFLEAKVKRAKELEKTNSNLGDVYLRFVPSTLEIMNVILNNSPGLLSFLTIGSFIGYLKQDQKLYEEIVGIFRAKPEEKHYARPRRVVDKGSAKVAEDPRRKALRASVASGDLQLSRDANARIGYFADDVLSLGYDGARLDDLMGTFSDFNLGKVMRKRENRLSDLQFRNFLDDVTLEYVRKGAIPTKADLERLYQRECSVSKESK